MCLIAIIENASPQNDVRTFQPRPRYALSFALSLLHAGAAGEHGSRHQKETQMNQRVLLRHGQSDDSQRARDGYSVAVKFGSAKLFPRLVTLYS